MWLASLSELRANDAHKGASGFGSDFDRDSDVNLSGVKTRKLIALLSKHRVAVTPTLTVSLLPVRGERGAAPYYAGWSPFPQEWKREWARSYWTFLTPHGWSANQFKAAEVAGRKIQRNG